MMTRLLAACVILISMAAIPVSAEQRGFKEYTIKAPFEDVLADLKDAIINRGMKIDYVGHLNTMLTRTSDAVGSTTESGQKSPYRFAKFLQFCSAKLTHEVISANPQNIAVCPYVVFVYELEAKPGTIHAGYRLPVTGPSKLSRKVLGKVEKLLDDITKEATK